MENDFTVNDFTVERKYCWRRNSELNSKKSITGFWWLMGKNRPRWMYALYKVHYDEEGCRCFDLIVLCDTSSQAWEEREKLISIGVDEDALVITKLYTDTDIPPKTWYRVGNPNAHGLIWLDDNNVFTVGNRCITQEDVARAAREIDEAARRYRNPEDMLYYDVEVDDELRPEDGHFHMPWFADYDIYPPPQFL